MTGQEQIDIIQPIENITYVGVVLVLLRVNPYIV